MDNPLEIPKIYTINMDKKVLNMVIESLRIYSSEKQKVMNHILEKRHIMTEDFHKVHRLYKQAKEANKLADELTAHLCPLPDNSL